MPKNILNGKLGEDMAEIFLIEKGYEILRRNYRYKKSEIDIIALYNKILIFIEVKYRSNLNFGHPEAFVTTKKESMIITGAEQYIYDKNWMGKIRFDIISVDDTKNIMHFEDAF